MPSETELPTEVAIKRLELAAGLTPEREAAALKRANEWEEFRAAYLREHRRHAVMTWIFMTAGLLLWAATIWLLFTRL